MYHTVLDGNRRGEEESNLKSYGGEDADTAHKMPAIGMDNVQREETSLVTQPCCSTPPSLKKNYQRQHGKCKFQHR